MLGPSYKGIFLGIVREEGLGIGLGGGAKEKNGNWVFFWHEGRSQFNGEPWWEETKCNFRVYN